MIQASIDLGTNTCLLLVAEVSSQGRVQQILADFSTLVRLGEGVDQHRFLQAPAMDRTLACLRNYLNEIRLFKISPEEVICVATSQARDAKNSQEFFSRVLEETGFKFQILSGEEEAKLTFLGALLPGMQPAQIVLLDIGGGSTELIAHEKEDSQGHSLDMGSVRFTERFLHSNPVTDQEFSSCQRAVDEKLSALLPWRKKLPLGLQLVAVAGTATTLASIHLTMEQFQAAQIDQALLCTKEVYQLVQKLRLRTIEERCTMMGMQKGRADVLLAGAIIFWRVMELFEFPNCRISSRGLRFGVFSRLPHF